MVWFVGYVESEVLMCTDAAMCCPPALHCMTASPTSHPPPHTYPTLNRWRTPPWSMQISLACSKQGFPLICWKSSTDIHSALGRMRGSWHPPAWLLLHPLPLHHDERCTIMIWWSFEDGTVRTYLLMLGFHEHCCHNIGCKVSMLWFLIISYYKARPQRMHTSGW